MLTRCPLPSCLFEFELAADTGGTVGTCPRCGQHATFKPADILDKLENAYQRQVQEGLVSGGPEGEKNDHLLFTAAVENVRSLWNVGSIFRTADGAGFSRLYLCGITGCPPRKEIAKTSLGAEQAVFWQYCRNILEVIPSLRKDGVMIVGLERTGDSLPLSEALASRKLRTPLCLLLGNEVTGLSAEALSVCDLVCDLPMRGVKGSLNVAVAFGIAAYQLTDNLPEKTAGTVFSNAKSSHR